MISMTYDRALRNVSFRLAKHCFRPRRLACSPRKAIRRWRREVAQKEQLKPLKSLARVNLCASGAGFRPAPSLVQAELRAASDGMAPDSLADRICISRIRRRAREFSGLESSPRDDRSHALVSPHNIRRIRRKIALHPRAQTPTQSKQRQVSLRGRLMETGFVISASSSIHVNINCTGGGPCGKIPALFGRRTEAMRRSPPYSAACRRGSAALSSAWPKSSIRSSTSSRPTDNLSRPGAMPSAARCSGLSR